MEIGNTALCSVRCPNVLLLHECVFFFLSLESSSIFPQSRDMGVRSIGDSITVPCF